MARHSTVRDFGRQAPTGFGVRRARSPDAEAAATVLRASISMLCAADHGNQLAIVARRHETPDRDPSGGHGAIPSGPGNIDAVVFSGGGVRCFWQAGFWQAVQASLPRPAVVASVGGGAALAAVLFADCTRVRRDRCRCRRGISPLPTR